MSAELLFLLDEIARDQRRAGEAVDPPATPATVAAAGRFLRERFQMTLPPVLAALWAVRDGVDFNGMVLYRAGTDARPTYRASLAEVNAVFGRVTGDRYLYLGEAGMESFLHDRRDGGWHMADRVSLDSFDRFNSCEALILAVLRKSLAI